MMNPSNPYIQCALTDMDGQLRGKCIHSSKMDSSKGVLGFCDVVMGWDMHDDVYPSTTDDYYPDAWVQIDKSTKRIHPNGMDWYLMDFDVANSHLRSICPRTLLKQVVNQYKSLGYTIKAAHELEWFVFEHNAIDYNPVGRNADGYSLLKMHEYQSYVQSILQHSTTMNMPLEGLHPETGAGAWEASLLATDALEAADRSTLLKYMVKALSIEQGWVASFMAKWNLDKPGAGGHMHMSLWDESQSKNWFLEKPEWMEYFMAGVLKYMPECLLIYAPNINSYQRLIKGSWAPTTISWGYENRTTALRCIQGFDGQNPHVELRVPGADANPYLVLAVYLMAGLEGIQQRYPLVDALSQSAYSSSAPLLPKSMPEAIEKYAQSDWMKTALGNDLFQHYLKTRQLEFERTQSMTHQELVERYIERL